MDSTGKILLHHVRLPSALDAAVEARWMSRLADVESNRLARLGREQRLESLAARALLSHAAQACGLKLPLSAIAHTAGARPYWPGGPDFSIAHAAGWAACALAPAGIAVGLDLEASGSVGAESLRLVTSANERAALAQGSINATWLWVCKEAVLKAAGLGVVAAAQVVIVGDVGHHAGRSYALRRVALGDAVVAALAVDPGAGELEVIECPPEVLFGTGV